MSRNNLTKGKPRKITQDMVNASTSLTKSSNESPEAYLKRVTHLHLQTKRISKIEGLEQCTNLKVLYLYDNIIEKVENLDFATNLQYLQLQNNLIKDFPKLQMQNLTKLFLDENEISFVTGLDACNKLEELHISNQRMPTYTSLIFDSMSLEAISYTLQVLEISGNFITNLTPFICLQNLRKLSCSNNSVTDIAEIELIICHRYLIEANFEGNPCCKSHKYRDCAISASAESLRMLDNLPILRHQQVAIKALMDHRKKIGANFLRTAQLGIDSKNITRENEEDKDVML